MKVTKHIAFKLALAFAVAGFASCSSDEGQMEEPVQGEAASEEEFTEHSDEMGDGVEDGMLAEDAAYEDTYADDTEPMDSIATNDNASDFTDAEFDTAVDEPIDNNAQSMSFMPVEQAKPAPATFTASTQKSGQHAYVVQAGDTLSKIARRIYGNAGEWQKLASMNSLSNPHKIFPGDTIFFESNAETDDFATAFNNVQKHSYTVKAGDTLASISHSVFGTPSRWKVLWGYNWKNIENPHKIFVGQQLWYVQKNDMQNFLAKFDNDSGSAKLVKQNYSKPTKTVVQPVVAKPAPAAKPVTEEVFEEVIVEEEVPVAEEDVVEEGEIIEDIVVDEEAVIDDEEVFEDFEEAIEE